jgi:hypothetical protein
MSRGSPHYCNAKLTPSVSLIAVTSRSINADGNGCVSRVGTLNNAKPTPISKNVFLHFFLRESAATPVRTQRAPAFCAAQVRALEKMHQLL